MASVGKAFIELAIEGFRQVQQTLNSVAKQVTDTTGTAVVSVAVNGVKQVQQQLDAVGKQVDATNKTATVKVQVSGAKEAEAQLKTMYSNPRDGKQYGAGTREGKILAQEYEKEMDKAARKRLGLDTELNKAATGLNTTKGAFAGLSAVTSQIKSQFAAIGQKLQGIGQGAAVGFAGASAAILKFVQLADPVGFERFQLAIGKMGIQIGRFFIPIVREATAVINGITNWFKGLDDSTRDTVLGITKVGLVLLGLGAALVPIVKIGTALATIGSVIASVGTGVGAAVAVIVGAVGFIGVALAAAQGQAVDFSSIGSVLKAAWQGVAGIFNKIVAAIMPFVQMFGQVFSEIGSAVLPAMAEIGKVIESVFDDSLKSVGSIFKDIGNAVLSVVPSAKQIGLAFGGVKTFIVTLGSAFSGSFNIIKTLIATLTPVVVALVNMLVGGCSKLFPIYDRIQTKIQSIIAVATKAANQIIQAIKPIFDDVMPIIETVFNSVVVNIESTFALIEPQIDSAVMIIKAAINIIVDSWKFVSRVVRTQIGFWYDAFQAFVTFVNTAIDAYNTTIGKIAGKLNHLALPERKVLTVDEKFNPDKKEKDSVDPNKFRGETRRKNEIIALEELFKKNLTTDTADPALLLAKEQRNESRTTNEKLGTIIEQLGGLRQGDLRT